MAELTLRRRRGDDETLGRAIILGLGLTLTVLPASAAPLAGAAAEVRPCEFDARSDDWRQRFARARLVPELGARAVRDERETAVIGFLGWPLDRPLPRGLATSPSLAEHRWRLASRLRDRRARLARVSRHSLRDAVDGALDLGEVDAELDALEDCR